MDGETENTPLTGEKIAHDQSKHFPVAQMRGHGVRTLGSDAQSLPSDESTTEWKPEDGGEDSDLSALMNLVTAPIGSGVVYLPYAAGECGLILALILSCVMALVSAHSATIVGTVLLMARNIAKKAGNESVILTFEDMSKVCWGAVGLWITSVLFYLELYLVVAVFMGTLAAGMNDLIAEFIQNSRGETEDERGENPIEFWWLVVSVFGFMALVMPLCWLKSLDAISKMSIVGVIANFVILVCIVISAFANKGSVADEKGLNFSIHEAYINGISPYVNTDSRMRKKVAHMFGPSGDSHCAAFGTVDECNAAGCTFNMFTDAIGGCIGEVCSKLTQEAACNDKDGCAYVNGFCGNQGQLQYRLFDFGGMWAAYGIFAFSHVAGSVVPSVIDGMKNPGHLGRVVWSSQFIICAIYCAFILVSFFGWGNGVISWSGNGVKDAVEECNVDVASCPTEKCMTFTFPATATNPGEQCVSKMDFHVDGSSVIKHDFMPSLAVQTTAMVGLLVSVVSSVPVFFFSMATTVEHLVKKKWPNVSDFFLRYINRTILMAICVAPILALNANYPNSENLAALQGLTGSFTSTIICFILPNLLFLCMITKFPKGHKFRRGNVMFSICCAIAITVGVFTMIVGFLADGLKVFGVKVFY